MMNDEEPTVEIVKRAWHAPELRKNDIRDDTQNETGFGLDGFGGILPITST